MLSMSIILLSLDSRDDLEITDAPSSKSSSSSLLSPKDMSAIATLAATSPLNCEPIPGFMSSPAAWCDPTVFGLDPPMSEAADSGTPSITSTKSSPRLDSLDSAKPGGTGGSSPNPPSGGFLTRHPGPRRVTPSLRSVSLLSTSRTSLTAPDAMKNTSSTSSPCLNTSVFRGYSLALRTYAMDCTVSWSTCLNKGMDSRWVTFSETDFSLCVRRMAP